MNDESDLALLKRSVEEIDGKLTKLEADISDLVKAWNAAGTLVTFVKWAAGIVTALTTLAIFLTGGMGHK